MLFQNKAFMVGTAVTVLVCFGWLASGGRLLVEVETAMRDPAGYLSRLVEDPRLSLSQAQKDSVRRFASRMSPEPRQAPVQQPLMREEDWTTTEMQALASALEQLSVPPSSATKDEVLADPARIAAVVTDTQLRLQALHQRLLGEFAETEQRLLSARLPAVILARHEAARLDYEKGFEEVSRGLEVAARSQEPREVEAALASVVGLLRRSTSEPAHRSLDLSRLPFRNAQPVQREPLTASTEAGLRASAASPTPTPDDLAANEDVQLTEELKALAASLENEPARIYDWVRNNIAFVPTYGSVQGAQMTLVARRGNAFDTASLLIALLRAAGIPARYVTGTIEVPVAEVMNWVGGVASADVAQQLLGQGGVPNVGLIRDGTLTHIRLEHVWVEAFIDYIPSRGAVQHEGDTWVPMDAAFKLHTFTARSNLFTDVPIDSLLAPGDKLFDLDERLGKITNVDVQPLDERLAVWAEQSDTYLLSHGIEGTVDGLLGGKKISQETHTIFPGSLPYEVITRQGAVSTLPARLRHSVRLEGYASQLDRAFGSPSFSFQLSLPALNSRRLSLQFDPATQADADTLTAARNSGASALPVYLVQVVPVLELDGVPVSTGSPVGMGRSYFLDAVLQAPEGATTVPFQVTAGDEIVVGITGNGVTKEVVEKRFAANPVDNAPEYLHQVQLHYWTECDALGEVAARSLGVHMLRLPSVGVFSSPLSVSLLFGVPRAGVYQSRNMDVRQSLIGAAGEDPSRVIAFMKQAGLQGSYLEGAVFDQLRSDSDPGSRGFSAVHLISAATAQGVPIYHITSANASSALPMLALDSEVESDIQTALSQGKTVLVPEKEIDLGPWRGVGYIIQDETTGAGAYMISGGLAGGGLTDCLRELVPIFELVLFLILAILLAILIILLLNAAAAALAGLVGAAGAAAAFSLFLLSLRGFSPLGSGLEA
ncbi:transglutaminase domain-containing protein [Archangium violaceum]|uniref:transglutaminase-like domain-containing protein n=1 Tax=Archangium violaceum TaxID=83451 RepID=UPI00193BC9DA|nr:transglutaminase-like domain-containing protein [Archangium violaceum]QRK10008.1 transglutaminase domain-containing protein [Archangium violaceum]